MAEQDGSSDDRPLRPWGRPPPIQTRPHRLVTGRAAPGDYDSVAALLETVAEEPRYGVDGRRL